MPISDSTIKRLFVKSRNQCAMPCCKSPLVIGDNVLGEICHISARRKTGPRYNPNLSSEQRDSFANLILLCPTCHSFADKAPATYTAELLTEIKELHERDAPLEITAETARQALLVFEKHRPKKTTAINRSPVKSRTRAIAAAGGVAIAISGHNQGPITVNLPKKNNASGTRYPANSIGADANMTNYVEYLCDLWVKYMTPTGLTDDELWGRSTN